MIDRGTNANTSRSTFGTVGAPFLMAQTNFHNLCGLLVKLNLHIIGQYVRKCCGERLVRRGVGPKCNSSCTSMSTLG